jgi:hypothetical protein
MVMLAAKQDGLFTAAATWALVDPSTFLQAGSTSGSFSTNNNVIDLTTLFATGGIQIDGFALRFVGRIANPTGTMTVRMHDGTSVVAGTSVTVNLTDIPYAQGGDSGWTFFKFAAPVTLPANVKIQYQCSTVVNSITYFCNGSATAAWRYLRTTTAQAPVAGDMLCITGEYTGAGTSNLRTVTMDDAAAGATAYGQIDVCSKSTLQYGVAASTNYHLKLAGNLNVNAGGTFNAATPGSRLPASSTAVLEFACTSNVQYGLEFREGSFGNAGGALKTVKAYLAADAAAAAVSLTTDVSTSWKSGDEIGIASTTRTSSECEKRTLSADAVTTTLSVPALTNAHGGIAPVRAELINLTRNVKIRGASASLQAYVSIAATAVVDFQHVEFYWLGSSTGGKRGVDIVTTSGSCSIQFCAFHDFSTGSGVCCNIVGATANNITYSNNVSYNLVSGHVQVFNATSGTNIVIDSNVAMLCINTSPLFNILDVGITFTNNVAVGSPGAGFTISEAAVVTGTFSGNVAHSNSGVGATISSVFGGTIGVSAWRNNSSGIAVNSCFNLTIDTLTSFGNNSRGLEVNGTSGNFTVKNPNMYGGTTLVQSHGLYFSSNCYGFQVDGGSLGSPSAHSTADIGSAGGSLFITGNLHNTLLASPTELSGNAGSWAAGSRVGSQRHDQTAGNHRSWLREGTIIIDTALFDASPSERLTPALSAEKLKSGRLRVAVLNGQTVTFTIKVRKSTAGDGTAYNGNQPRLMLEKHVAAGIAADTPLATASGAAGQWETLTGTTPAAQGNTVFTFYVDCDGTTGWVNVDTAGAS